MPAAPLDCVLIQVTRWPVVQAGGGRLRGTGGHGEGEGRAGQGEGAGAARAVMRPRKGRMRTSGTGVAPTLSRWDGRAQSLK